MAQHRMLINYVPGEECRVAIVSAGKLEELHAERLNAVSHVGNIYVGKVVNVEPSIQAAFIDFGLEHNGFLHISDLHPRYFPGGDDESTEQVGKKTPRRNRPPIQEALKRGQEIVVQVLKEGIGTKGPTLTSYLSIPGRFLVMMPDMDNVGVSRKVDDEDQRRQMRQILDQLELPEGFGFILRTAGMDRTKAELKRDLAYLQRLWKDIERRRRQGNKPRLLYAESDLLVRALRDVLTAEIEEIIVDEESALVRAAKFLKIIAPRSSINLVHYDRLTPIFHAFGVEEQIQRIHAREVPLPSGGYLVIDETEALVAIDVNSGKMRQHGDAETTAFKTNCEAVDEICRQLRLRDLGGLVLNDLIDMRSKAHQREIEHRFRENLKRDRARSKTLPISQFGIIEMTRQRMRGSLSSVHFADCPHCHGRGLVQRPDSVASDAMRELACILQHDRVARVEMVVSPRVAGELLSHKRVRLGRLERVAGKHVDVRVSETIAVDQIAFYAYDERGADIEIDRLPALRPPDDLPIYVEVKREVAASEGDWAVDPLQEGQAAQIETEHEAEAPVAAGETEFGMDLMEIDDATAEAELSQASAGGGANGDKKRRRRRRGRGRGRDQADEGAPAQQRAQAPQARRGGAQPPAQAPGARHAGPPREAQIIDDWDAEEAALHGGPPVAPRAGQQDEGFNGGPAGEGNDNGNGEQGEGGRKRRRRRRRRGRGRGGAPGEAQAQGASGAAQPLQGGSDDEWDGDSVGEPEGDGPMLEHKPVNQPAPSMNGAGRDHGQPQTGAEGGEGGEGGGRKRRRRRRRRGRGRAGQEGVEGAQPGGATGQQQHQKQASGDADSWDVTPEELRAQSGAGAQHDEADPVPDAGPGRGDSWDLEPHEVAPAKFNAPEDQAEESEGGDETVADEDDGEGVPVEAGAPSPLKKAGKKKASRTAKAGVKKAGRRPAKKAPKKKR